MVWHAQLRGIIQDELYSAVCAIGLQNTELVAWQSVILDMHLSSVQGCISSLAAELRATKPDLIDTSATSATTDTYGDNAQQLVEGLNIKALWGGNANQDPYLILVGGGLSLPDRDHIFFELFLTLWAANPNGDISYNSVLDGYFNSDTNMDGQVKFQGPDNDIDALIFFNILYHPSNTNFLLNYIVTEQIP